jgi:hypothetical protein
MVVIIDANDFVDANDMRPLCPKLEYVVVS